MSYDRVFILERIANVYGVEITRGWQVRLAEKMQLTDTSMISNWKKRGVPNEVILKVAEEKGVNSLWLRTGQGEKYKHQHQPDQAREAPSGYTPQPLAPDELNLIKLYRQLHPAEQEKVVEIAELYAKVKESRSNVGGGSVLKESNSK